MNLDFRPGRKTFFRCGHFS